MINKWAIIGLGFIAPRHIAAIRAIGDEIIAVCDVNSKQYHANFGNRLQNPPQFFEGWLGMMFNPVGRGRGYENRVIWPQVTHVAICTPTQWHYRMAMEKEMIDKVVLCEKPLTCSTAQCEALFGRNVYTVLQLRHHPEVIRLKQELDLRKKHTVRMAIKVFRDKKYWKSWKGNEGESGGILFNIGIHYFDLLIHLFGNEYKIIQTLSLSEKLKQGVLKFGNTEVDYHIEILNSDKGQDRRIEIDGKEISLSNKDNLAYEDLHVKVYEALKRGEGVRPEEAYKSIKLVERLKYAN